MAFTPTVDLIDNVAHWTTPRGHRCLRGAGGCAIALGNGTWHCDDVPISCDGPIVQSYDEALAWCRGDRLR